MDDEEVRRLLVEVVPEIADGRVEVVRCARIPGFRTKIAVRSTDPTIDPVDVVVGPEGARIRRVVQHLRGEAIDIVPFAEMPAHLLARAVAPAEIERIVICGDDVLEAIVADDQYERIVGPSSQLLQLAAEIVGMRVDVLRRSTVDRREADGREVFRPLRMHPGAVEALVRAGIYDLAAVPVHDRPWLVGLIGEENTDKLLAAAVPR